MEKTGRLVINSATNEGQIFTNHVWKGVWK